MEFLRMSARDFRNYINGKPIKKETPFVETATNKYHAKKTAVGGRTFDSKKESKRYLQLKDLQEQGAISGLECQKRFVLVDGFEYRGEKIRGVTWVADFFYYNGREWVAEDVKSPVTRKKAEYTIKKKLFMIRYPKILFNEFL